MLHVILVWKIKPDIILFSMPKCPESLFFGLVVIVYFLKKSLENDQLSKLQRLKFISSLDISYNVPGNPDE